jgi:hypothetical protein
MKSITNKEINYSLHISENFKKELDSELSDVVVNISSLFINYFKFIIENIKLKQSNFARFIITRGLDTITNVFNFILFYTKNLDLTYFHCQKAFYLYVEFVSQISEDEKMFLQLNSKDATTYVYKKTIYEINNEMRKLNEEPSYYTKIKLNIINQFVNLYKTMLLKLINNDFTNIKHLNDLEELYKKFNKINNKLKINKLNNVIDKFYYKINDVEEFYKLINLLVKKISKTPDFLDIIEDNCLSYECLDTANQTEYLSLFTNLIQSK